MEFTGKEKAMWSSLRLTLVVLILLAYSLRKTPLVPNRSNANGREQKPH